MTSDMDSRYYDILRQASQEEFYQAINQPEDELYDLLWDLFENVVIEPAEIFDPDFREKNQFRYSIDSVVTLEFFPDQPYYQERTEPDPYQDGSDAAGIHLKFSIMPQKSCLFSARFHVWGRAERLAFKKLWRRHRNLLSEVFQKAKPMVFTAVPFPAMDHALGFDEMLDHYFSSPDAENSIELQYSFAQFDETELAQNFMVYMSLLYHSIRNICQHEKDRFEFLFGRISDFYSGRPPDLPAPLPCVEFVL
ncbi:MAG: hypothetical protein ACRD1R_19540 [Acidobacteriota bacterium]